LSIPGRASPIPGARIPLTGTRRYGDARETHTHAGVDLGGRDGTPVLAPEGGTVLAVVQERGRAPWRGYAPCVFLAGDSGRFHLLAHLSGSPLTLREGERVELGQQLGTIGAPEHHTHWEVRTVERRRREPAIDVSLSPAHWLEGEDVSLAAGPIPAATPPNSRDFLAPAPSSASPQILREFGGPESSSWPTDFFLRAAVLTPRARWEPSRCSA